MLAFARRPAVTLASSSPLVRPSPRPVDALFLFALCVWVAIGLLLAPAPSLASTNLCSFSSQQYDEGAQPNAGWVASGDCSSVEQVVDNNARSFWLSGFSVDDEIISFDMRVENDDNDAIGFTWGYQDSSHFYYLNWNADKKAPGTIVGSFIGISSAGGAPSEDDWNGTGADSVKFDIFPPGWIRDTTYQVILDLSTAGQFHIQISSPTELLADAIIVDDSYASGQFGFFTGSQGGATFSNLSIIPEPSTAILVAMGLALLGARSSRQRACSE
jgi:hypothetical protein